MARILTYYSPLFLEHADPLGEHPECPQRLTVAREAILRVAGEAATIESIGYFDEGIVLSIHSRDYVEFIKHESARGFHYIDPDTYVCERTFDAATAAVAAAWIAAERSLKEDLPVLALVRPPGHHAGRNGRALNAPTNGFCIFNNAVAAVRRFRELGLRTLVLDFDAHHGNGTQEILWREEVPHIDLHEWGAYPGSGWFTDVGGDRIGCKVNIPLPHGGGDQAYLWALREVVLPVIAGFRPDAIVVSAGFDAHTGDLMTTLQLSTKVFRLLGSIISGLRKCGLSEGIVAVLEGGYLPSLADAFAGFITGMLNPVTLDEVFDRLPRSPGVTEDWFRRGCEALVARLRRVGLVGDWR